MWHAYASIHIISLFAETVLHVGQVPMIVFYNQLKSLGNWWKTQLPYYTVKSYMPIIMAAHSKYWYMCAYT